MEQKKKEARSYTVQHEGSSGRWFRPPHTLRATAIEAPAAEASLLL